MINLFDFINEGIFADVDTIMQQGTNMVDANTIEKWSTGEKCRITKKKNGYKITGDFKMTWDDTTYTGPKIVEVVGNFSISNSKLITLEGIFDPYETEITGTFTLENNDNLVSLSGCPMQVGTLTIANNKSLKDIDIAPHVLNNAYISKNGKRFKQEDLAKKINVYKKIFCSMDDEANIVEGEMVNEAFKAPQLKLVADAIKNATGKDTPREKQFKLSDIFTIEWDKIEPSQITELSTDDPKCIRLAKQYMSDKIQGIMVLMDGDGKVCAIINRKRFYKIDEKYRRSFYYNNDIGLTHYNSSDDLSVNDIIGSINNHDMVMFIQLDRMKMYNDWSKIRMERNSAKRGAVALQRGYERNGNKDAYGEEITTKHVRYYQSIADENRSRYDKMLQEIKSKRATMSSNFANIKARLDKAFKRYTDLLAKVLSEPKKYNEYDIRWLNDMFATASARDKWSVNESGLLMDMEDYIGYMVRAAKGDLYNSNKIEATVKFYEEKIINRLDRVETKLTELESK